MLLTDGDLYWLQETYEVIKPFDPWKVQPASYDLTLGEGFKAMSAKSTPLDPRLVNEDDYLDQGQPDGTCLLTPGGFLLVTTAEWVNLPDNYAARVEGKSSLGRVGLAIHTTAGWIDPGFHGNITLELSNLGRRWLVLTPGMKIAQLAFFECRSHAISPYGSVQAGSAYQGQTGVTGSKGTRG